MTHTPGPWRVTEWPGVSGDTHFGIDAQKWRLAIVHSGNADDATLMAAAPDLYAACLALRASLADWIDIQDRDDERSDDDKALAFADAAIAKAEGRE